MPESGKTRRRHPWARRPARAATSLAAAVTIVASGALPPAGAQIPSDRRLTFSGRCPIDVIFPMRVRAERVRELELVPRRYELLAGPDGSAVMVVSLLRCDETRVNGAPGGPAVFSDMLFVVESPFGTAAVPPDHQADGYWSWLLTSNRRIHARLARLGMFHGFDRRMRLSGTWTETPLGRRLVSLRGSVSWRRAPFEITGSVVDTAVPEGSDFRFWQDVEAGVLRSRLVREAGAEEGSAAHYTLTTPVDSPIAQVLEEQCAAEPSARTCRVSGPGFLTHIVREFVHHIEVRPAAAW